MSAELADLGFLGERDRLRCAVEELARVADLRPDGSQRAGDESGAVQVTVDARGRVIDVGVVVGWRQRLEPGRFGAAVFDAYLAAVGMAQAAAAIRAWGVGQDGSVRRPPPMPAGGRSPRPSAPWRRAWPVVGDDRWLERGWEELDAIRAERRRYADVAARGRQVGARRRSVTGPSGRVRVEFDGRRVAAVRVDPGWLRGVSAQRVAGDALAVLRAVPGDDGGR